MTTTVSSTLNMKPVDIKVDVMQKTLYLAWEDGTSQTLPHQLLRQHCPCAFCRMKRLQDKPLIALENITITAIYDQGYGVQICFDDQHQQGIFPWSFLKSMQACGFVAK